MAATFALDAGIMAVELPTAFPYFGAIAAIIGSSTSLGTRVALAVAYNIAFVLPLVAVIVVRMAARDAATHRLHHFGTWLAHHAGTILACAARRRRRGADRAWDPALRRPLSPGRRRRGAPRRPAPGPGAAPRA